MKTAKKIDLISYDIRGPLLDRATQMEREGHNIIRLNIGNVPLFGFNPPDSIVKAIVDNMHNSSAYIESRGLLSSRECLADYYKRVYKLNYNLDDIFIGNGVSELIYLLLSTILDPGDEILLPSPDYPLWTAVCRINLGEPRYYQCKSVNAWQPDPDEIESLINARTKAIVLINPNNPTGAVYSTEILQRIAEIAKKNDVLILSDEIYDRIVYDDLRPLSIAHLVDDFPVICFSGLSKVFRAPGYRCGWMLISDPHQRLRDIKSALDKTCSMRLCSNVAVQYAIPHMIDTYHEMDALVAQGGRLYEQRNLAYKKLNQIDGLSVTKPRGAFYIFPEFDDAFDTELDVESFLLDFLETQKILLVPGDGFNYTHTNAFRMAFLPELSVLDEAISRLDEFMTTVYEQKRYAKQV